MCRSEGKGEIYDRLEIAWEQTLFTLVLPKGIQCHVQARDKLCSQSPPHTLICHASTLLFILHMCWSSKIILLIYIPRFFFSFTTFFFLLYLISIHVFISFPLRKQKRVVIARNSRSATKRILAALTVFVWRSVLHGNKKYYHMYKLMFPILDIYIHNFH